MVRRQTCRMVHAFFESSRLNATCAMRTTSQRCGGRTTNEANHERRRSVNATPRTGNAVVAIPSQLAADSYFAVSPISAPARQQARCVKRTLADQLTHPPLTTPQLVTRKPQLDDGHEHAAAANHDRSV